MPQSPAYQAAKHAADTAVRVIITVVIAEIAFSIGSVGVTAVAVGDDELRAEPESERTIGIANESGVESDARVRDKVWDPAHTDVGGCELIGAHRAALAFDQQWGG